MKRMQGKIDESDDLDFSGEEQESDGQFFDGDGDLQEVELDEMESGGEELEEEYGEEMDAASYDEEIPFEESEEELVEKPQKGKKGKDKKNKKIAEKTIYASYEEFAHLLEQ